jgi:hypothetical protein
MVSRKHSIVNTQMRDYMARPKKQVAQQRESPIQFRPGSELGHLVRNFAEGHQLTPPEACRLLISLAVAEMDCRFAGLVLPLTEVMGGENAYVRGCEHVHTALQAARRATKRPMQLDPERAQFIEETVQGALKERGAGERFQPLEFLHGVVDARSQGSGEGQPMAPEVPEPPPAAEAGTASSPRMRRTIRKPGRVSYPDDEDDL